MKMKIIDIFESITEVSQELYQEIKSNYRDSRLIMSKDSEIVFKSRPDQKAGPKPRGLWYGIGSSWIDWVRMEMPDWEADNVFKIDIDESRVKIIRTFEEILEFDKQYGFDMERYMGWRSIDWVSVAEDWGGIEIAPYIYEARMKLNWYYGWDVASGCIWSDGVVKNIQKIG